MAKTKFQSTPKSEIVKECRDRFELIVDTEQEWREKAVEDLTFLDPDKQWDEQVKQTRMRDGRPVLSVDRIGPVVRQIANDFRQNTPSIKVSPTDTEADVQTADIISGLIRNIEATSNAKMAYTTAYDNAVKVGKGYLRLYSDFVHERSMDQELHIEAIENAFSVYLDPTYTQPDASDAEWAIIVSDIPENQFKELWPKAEVGSGSVFEAPGNELNTSSNLKQIRVLEYFYKKRVAFELHKLQDGSIVEGPLDEETKPFVVKSRDSFKTIVKIIKTQGTDILSETEWPSQYLPIVPVFGDCLNINGKRDYKGIIRAAKDAQKTINLQKSSMAEMIAIAPRAPWIGPKGFVGNRGNEWANSNVRNVPYLEYEPYDETGQPLPPPQRNFGEPAIQALAMVSNIAEGDIKATTSAYDPVMGQSEAKQSGRAILALQNQGQISNLHFIDNFSRALRVIGKQILEVLPVFYDVPRVIRIIGADQKEQMVNINIQDDKFKRIFDMNVGRYDVICDMGPGYATKRAETQAVILESLKLMPTLAQVAPDKLVSALVDDPIADDLSARLKKTVPQELLSKKDLEADQEGQSVEQAIPPKFQQQMNQLMEMNKALTEELNNIAKDMELKQYEKELKQYEIESRERIALLQEENKLTIAMLNKGSVEPAAKMAAEIDARQTTLEQFVPEAPEPSEQLPEQI